MINPEKFLQGYLPDAGIEATGPKFDAAVKMLKAYDSKLARSVLVPMAIAFLTILSMFGWNQYLFHKLKKSEAKTQIQGAGLQLECPQGSGVSLSCGENVPARCGFFKDLERDSASSKEVK